jgi:hypothetical protein
MFNRLNHNKKVVRITFSIVILSVLLFIILDYNNIEQAIDVYRLYKHSVSPPSFIGAIAPFPGSNFPSNPFSRPYWGFVDDLEGVCLRINGKIVLNYIELQPFDIDSSYRIANIFPRDSVQLFMDDYLINQESLLIQNAFPYEEIYNPPGFEPETSNFVPVELCWRMIFTHPGLHLLEFKMKTYDNQLISYRWAFKVEKSK